MDGINSAKFIGIDLLKLSVWTGGLPVGNGRLIVLSILQMTITVLLMFKNLFIALTQISQKKKMTSEIEIKRKINSQLKGQFFAVGIRRGMMSHEAAEAIIAAIARGEWPEITITYPIKNQGEKNV